MKLERIIKFKNGKKRNNENGCIPVYGGNGILGYTDTYNAREKNIIIGRVGAYCGCVYKNDNECWISDNAIVGNVYEGYDYLFMYYLLKNMNLNNLHIGSSHPLMTQDILNNIEVNLPNYQYQQRASKILDIIDRKIDKNNQINDNLYNMGLIQYKDWIESIKGNKETTYKDYQKLGKIVMGQSPKGESYNNDNIGLPLINGAADYENGYLKAQKYTSMPTKICKKNDLIFCIRATIGLLTICDKEYCLGRGVASITDIDEKYKEYAYYLINNSIEEFKKLATGSVIVGISKDDISDIKIKIPTDEQIGHFHDMQKPIFEKINNIRKENQSLISLRDILLPKLMNGEINLDKIEI